MFATLLYRMAGEPNVVIDAPFVDVPSNKYYTKAVNWAYDHGIIVGTTSTTFEPTASITRSHAVLMLHRYSQYAGSEFSNYTTINVGTYEDYNELSYNAKTSMYWALSHDIIRGIVVNGSVYLYPHNLITRAEVATIIDRYQIYSGIW